MESPDESDDFSGNTLGLQWQWNANHSKDWYQMEQPGLRLYAQKYEGALCDAPHLLLQKWTAPSFTVRAKIQVQDLKDGDMAGLVSQGCFYTALGVEKKDGVLSVVQISGTIGGKEKIQKYGAVGGSVIELGLEVFENGTGQFYFPDVTGKWQPVGEKFTFTPGYWVGVKYGLFATHAGAGVAGSIVAESVLTGQDHLFEA